MSWKQGTKEDTACRSRFSIFQAKCPFAANRNTQEKLCPHLLLSCLNSYVNVYREACSAKKRLVVKNLTYKSGTPKPGTGGWGASALPHFLHTVFSHTVF